jgi:hypothetical protein
MPQTRPLIEFIKDFLNDLEKSYGRNGFAKFSKKSGIPASTLSTWRMAAPDFSVSSRNIERFIKGISKTNLVFPRIDKFTNRSMMAAIKLLQEVERMQEADVNLMHQLLSVLSHKEIFAQSPIDAQLFQTFLSLTSLLYLKSSTQLSEDQTTNQPKS